MKLKSYFATTVEAAMSLARQELGPEAMLMNSRRTTSENRHLGEYEVVFALVPEEKPAADSVDLRTAPESLSLHHLAIQVGELKCYIERMSAAFARARVSHGTWRPAPSVAGLLATLLDAGVNEETAEEIILRASQFAAPEPALPEVLAGLLKFDSSLGKPDKTRRVVALVGPPGSGKTTTLVKLAARFAVAAKRPAQIISADSVRIAAVEQLRSYAAILGIGFQSVETGHALSVALDEHRHKDLILIDTPGLSARDLHNASDLAPFLSSHPEVDVHLVAPASMRSRDLTRAIDEYQMFAARKLIFTRLDETDSPGVVLNECVRTGLPVSFLANGQQVPEDLEPATVDLLTRLLYRTSTAEALAMAGRH